MTASARVKTAIAIVLADVLCSHSAQAAQIVAGHGGIRGTIVHFDLSTPAVPVITTLRDIRGTIADLAALSNTTIAAGLQRPTPAIAQLDFSNPASVVEHMALAHPEMGTIRTIVALSGTAFVAGYDGFGGRLAHVDMSNPTSPVVTDIAGAAIGRIDAVAALPDGNIVAAYQGAGFNPTIAFFDITNLQAIVGKIIFSHASLGTVRDIEVLPDGNIITAYDGFDGSLVHWNLSNLASPQFTRIVQTGVGQVYDVEVFSNGNIVAAYAGNGFPPSIVHFDLSNLQAIVPSVVFSHADMGIVRDIEILPDGNIVTGYDGFGGALVHWDLSNLASPVGTNIVGSGVGIIGDIAVLPSGNLVVGYLGAGFAPTVAYWDISNLASPAGRVLLQQSDIKNIGDIEVLPNGNVVAGFDYYNAAITHVDIDNPSSPVTTTVMTGAEEIRDICALSQTAIAAGYQWSSPTISQFDLSNLASVVENIVLRHPEMGTIRHIARLSDTTFVAGYDGFGGRLAHFDVSNPTLPVTTDLVGAAIGRVDAIAVLADGNIVAAYQGAGFNPTIAFFDITNLQAIVGKIIFSHASLGTVRDIEVLPDGNLITGYDGFGGALVHWNISNLSSPVGTNLVPAGVGEIRDIEILPDGNMVAGYQGNSFPPSIVYFNLANLSPVVAYTLLQSVDLGLIEDIAVLPNGNLIAGYDGFGGKVQLTARAVDGEWVEIIVRDNGMGLSAEELDDVRRFVPGGTSKKTHGTGFGLPIAKRKIEDHGGLLAIESDEGKGTTVTITLPVDAGRDSE